MKTILPTLALPLASSAALAVTPIATADGEAPGTRVEVTQFTRTAGDTVTVKLTLVNGGDKELDAYGLLMRENGETHSVDGLQMVDPAGKKEYHVIRDSKGGCLCSRNLPSVAKGTSVSVWAKFPAPPAGVQKVSLVVPHFSPIDDLTLAK